MSEDAIIVEGLSKSYLIGHRHSSGNRYKYTALRDVIGQELRNFTRKAIDLARGRQIVQGDEIEQFHALSDVNFSVKKGEVVGIVGRNGAGKSTLLKILSRITEPTQGRVTMRGRVSSLLEVGTGFHPELTGRENIFLNGAVLGMTRQEILRKFDEIVAFAEVEKFLDTPVKRYSSGMYVRLAFAIAAHLEPEILIVDEVLAVGDAEFQNKCLGKMNEVSRTQGRTVLFVSHNMDAVRKLCTRAILFDSGRIQKLGDTESVVSAYLNNRLASPTVVDLSKEAADVSYRETTARLVSIAPADASSGWSVPFGSPITVDLTIAAGPSVSQVEIAMAVITLGGFELATWTNYCNGLQIAANPGRNTYRISIEAPRLTPGQYQLGIALGSGRGFDQWTPDAVSFEVTANAEAKAINADIISGAIVATASIVAVP